LDIFYHFHVLLFVDLDNLINLFDCHFQLLVDDLYFLYIAFSYITNPRVVIKNVK